MLRKSAQMLEFAVNSQSTTKWSITRNCSIIFPQQYISASVFIYIELVWLAVYAPKISPDIKISLSIYEN